jgi:hypothetical protein
VIAPFLVQTRWYAFLNLPTERTAFTDANVYDEYRWISQRAGPEDSHFGNQLICFALGLQNPTPLNIVTASDYTRPEQVQAVVRSLEEKHVQYVLWYAGLPTSSAPPSGDHLNPLRDYLRSHYHVAETFTNGDRLLKRQQWQMAPPCIAALAIPASTSRRQLRRVGRHWGIRWITDPFDRPVHRGLLLTPPGKPCGRTKFRVWVAHL